jgi:hypothetical protein
LAAATISSAIAAGAFSFKIRACDSRLANAWVICSGVQGGLTL